MSKLEWTPSQGEIVWVKVFSNWSKGTYIGYDVIKNQHLVREPEEGGGHLFISADVLPKNANPNESKIDKKLSSIDWLVQEITKKSINDQSHNVFLIVKQAKAMHKEEMANTWIKACEDILSAIENDTVASFSSEELFEQYYNETFGGNDENSIGEKLYTKDEVLDLLINMNSWPTTFEGREDITEWFEQGQYY